MSERIWPLALKTVMVLNSSLCSTEATTCLLSSSEKYWEGNYCIFMSKFSQYTVQGKNPLFKSSLHFLLNFASLKKYQESFSIRMSLKSWQGLKSYFLSSFSSFVISQDWFFHSFLLPGEKGDRFLVST